MQSPGDITALLHRITAGESEAEELLVPEVYAELRSIAARYLRRERGNHTLQATALVHEVYLRLTGKLDLPWESRAHFYAVASQVMRRYLTDYARRTHAKKRGGEQPVLSLEEVRVGEAPAAIELVALDQALARLEEMDPRRAKVVEMRFFGGMTEDEIGEVLGTSRRTVRRDWEVARAWIYGEMKK